MINPFSGFDPKHPLLSYVMRDVRGGRTPEGLRQYNRKVAWIIGGLMIAGLLLSMMGFYDPTYGSASDWYQIAVLYAGGAVGVGIFLFPIVDLVTLFYAAMSIRTEMGNVDKHELLKVSTLHPGDYIASRVVLARVRAWRVFIVMWALRILSVLLLGLLGLGGLIFLILIDGVDLSIEGVFYTCLITAGAIIFLVMLIFEPLWRFRMMSLLGVSVAARFQSPLRMWLGLAGLSGFIVGAQGLLAAAVTWSGAAMSSFVRYSLDYQTYSYDFRDQVSILAGIIPYALMPLIVWWLHNSLSKSRGRVAMAYIFARRGEDA